MPNPHGWLIAPVVETELDLEQMLREEDLDGTYSNDQAGVSAIGVDGEGQP